MAWSCAACTYQHAPDQAGFLACAVCHTRIHPTAARVTGICKPALGFLRVPQTATLCIKCYRFADPSEQWDLEELRALRTQSS